MPMYRIIPPEVQKLIGELTKRVEDLERVVNHMAIIKPPLDLNRLVYETKPACNSGEAE